MTTLKTEVNHRKMDRFPDQSVLEDYGFIWILQDSARSISGCAESTSVL